MTAESCWRRPDILVIAVANSVERSLLDSSTTAAGTSTGGATTTGAAATTVSDLGTDLDLAGIIHYIVVVI
jgi:hypothetical protein